MSIITSTQFKLPGYVVSNGATTGNPWLNPNYLLFVDDNLSESDANAGSASDVIIGGFNSNLPQNAVITGIEMKLIAKRGALASPAQTLTLYALDNTSGSDVLYPYIAPVSLTASLDEYILGSSNYLFASSFTADQINNLKFLLEANGDIYVDSMLLKVYYYIPDVVPEPDPIEGGCPTCNSPIQIQSMSLAQPFLVGESIFYLKKGSWAYPDGTPIQVEDLGDCGGEIPLVFDQGKPKGDTGNNQFEECAMFKTSEGTFETLPSGIVKVDLGSTDNRGLQFHTPYEHVDALMSDHPANSEVIITNSAIFESQHLRVCQIGSVVSAPIEVQENSVQVAKPVVILNFTGGGQTATQDLVDPEKVNINIPGFNVAPPRVVATTSYTSFDQLVDTGSADLDVSGLNRGAVIQISTQEDVTILDVTVGGVSCIQQAVTTDAPNNLRNESWTLVNPALGTQPVVVTLSAPAYLTFGAESLSEVDTSNMVGTTENADGNDNNPTLDLTTQNNNSIVIDGLTTAQTPILYTPGPAQGLNWSRTANNVVRQGASTVESAGIAPDIITMDYSITQSTPWVMTALEINGIPAVTPVVSPLTVESEFGSPSISNVVKIVTSGDHLTSPSAGEADISFQTVDKQITQTGNGFVLDNIIKSSGVDGEFNLSQADLAANAEVVGIVTKIIDPDNFVVVTEGFVVMDTLPAGAVTGDTLYLYDQNPGALTVVAPTDPLSIVKKMGQVIDDSTNLIYFHNYLGLTQDQITPSSGGLTVFDDFISITDPSVLTSDPVVLGKESWSSAINSASFGASTFPSEVNHPGILNLSETSTTYNGLVLGDPDSTFDFESPFIIEKVVRITTLGSTNAEYFFGLAVANSASSVQKRIGIYGDCNGPSLWHGETADGAANTSSGATAAIVADTWYKIKIVFDGTTVEWFVDGVSLGTTTATLPAGLGNLVMLGRRNGAGDNASWHVDYSSFDYEVTR